MDHLWIRAIGDLLGFSACAAGMHFNHVRCKAFKLWAAFGLAWLLLLSGDYDALRGPPDSFLADSVWRPMVSKYAIGAGLWVWALRERKKQLKPKIELPK
jgi:hypothetical protein